MAILMCVDYDLQARYALLVIMAGGVWSGIATSMASVTTTFADLAPEVRAVAIAFPGSATNLGNIYGAYLFPQASAPKYLLGFGVVSATLGTGAILYATLYLVLRRQKTRRDAEGVPETDSGG
ncbi:hypothetical protein B0T24DRAFT_684972 [Lasiosphaeria ovina]|uniref:Major facilitator superfamily (MFS) profile domain-containing protein n=1 Tax=Lasiosphaeria ovina TaxID=92902 RepID=A0AAE0JTK7_9PEZI|nr:hypothetical protein B0T24DRAFT_684972 [Lasiosphaeria ovina]